MAVYETPFETLEQWQPEAYSIRGEDECPICKYGDFYSYLLKDETYRAKVDKDGIKWEDCGYYCETCGWGNAGARMVNPDNPKHCPVCYYAWETTHWPYTLDNLRPDFRNDLHAAHHAIHNMPFNDIEPFKMSDSNIIAYIMGLRDGKWRQPIEIAGIINSAAGDKYAYVSSYRVRKCLEMLAQFEGCERKIFTRGWFSQLKFRLTTPASL